MPEVRNGDVTLHVEVDGAGEPVTVFAHGLTNSCRELAPFTPSLTGTAVRFCFRGHGHSSAPEHGYRFEDLASDLDAVARAYGARNAVGTSMGAGAIMSLLEHDPARFERIVMLLPASLDLPFRNPERFDGIADLLESYPKDEAIERILEMSRERYEASAVAPGARPPALGGHEPRRGRTSDPRGRARRLDLGSRAPPEGRGAGPADLP